MESAMAGEMGLETAGWRDRHSQRQIEVYGERDSEAVNMYIDMHIHIKSGSTDRYR
jgi:hypothetical protein